MGLGGYGIPCGSCGCSTTTPTRWVVAARGWTKPWMTPFPGPGGYYDSLPWGTIDTKWLGDSEWESLGAVQNLWGTIDAADSFGNGWWSGTAGGGGESTFEFKWEDGYQWIRVRDNYPDTPQFEAVFRRAVGSATTGSNVTGRVIFTPSDIYSLKYNGVTSTDYSGIGEIAYLATDAAPYDFAGKSFTITFAAGIPSSPWQSVSGRYYSVESLRGRTFEVDLVDLDNTYGCYQDTTTVGSYGRGCSVSVWTLGEGPRIDAGGSWQNTAGGAYSAAGCPRGDSFGSTASSNRTAYAFSVWMAAAWFDAFESGGVVTTGALPPFGTRSAFGYGPNWRTGWDSWWGVDAIGSLEISVS